MNKSQILKCEDQLFLWNKLYFDKISNLKMSPWNVGNLDEEYFLHSLILFFIPNSELFIRTFLENKVLYVLGPWHKEFTYIQYSKFDFRRFSSQNYGCFYHFNIHILQENRSGLTILLFRLSWIQTDNLTSQSPTSSLYSRWKLWIYFIFMKLETCGRAGWGGSVLNHIGAWHLSPGANEISPGSLGRLINESCRFGSQRMGGRPQWEEGRWITTTAASLPWRWPVRAAWEGRGQAVAGPDFTGESTFLATDSLQATSGSNPFGPRCVQDVNRTRMWNWVQPPRPPSHPGDLHRNGLATETSPTCSHV